MRAQPRGGKSWMNEEILSKIAERDRLFALMKEDENDQEVQAEYKKVRNIVVTLTRRAKRDYKTNLRFWVGPHKI